MTHWNVWEWIVFAVVALMTGFITHALVSRGMAAVARKGNSHPKMGYIALVYAGRGRFTLKGTNIPWDGVIPPMTDVNFVGLENIEDDIRMTFPGGLTIDKAWVVRHVGHKVIITFPDPK